MDEKNNKKYLNLKKKKMKVFVFFFLLFFLFQMGIEFLGIRIEFKFTARILKFDFMR